jgi:hypothetical protein
VTSSLSGCLGNAGRVGQVVTYAAKREVQYKLSLLLMMVITKMMMVLENYKSTIGFTRFWSEIREGWDTDTDTRFLQRV